MIEAIGGGLLVAIFLWWGWYLSSWKGQKWSR